MKLRTWCIRSGQILAKPVLVFAGFLVFLTIFNPATIQAEDGRGTITIRHENVPIQKVFQSIEKQSGYRFFYNETLLQGAVKVTLHLQNVSLQVALDACFRNQPLSYAIVDKTIIVKRRPEQQANAPIPAAVSFSAPKKGKLIAVRGKVTSNNVPVVGASIMIKGTDNGASTDKDGIFTLAEVDEEATLVVSSVSHEPREIRINGQVFITIDLAKHADDLDEAVVVAYNTTTQRKNVGAVTIIKGDQVRDLPFRSVDKALQGQVPGLLVTSGTGQPGGGLSNFVLRGIATGQDPTGGSTVRNPLIVIDGIPVNQDHNQMTSNLFSTPVINPMAQLNMTDIENITVLKDAAAISLYGSKASNGVILITTKKGKAGKTSISFRNQTDLAQRLKGKIELLNNDEYLDLLYETYRSTNATLWTDFRIDSVLKKNFPTRADGSLYPFSNWEDEVFTKTANTVSNELSFSGGNDKSNFFLNLEYIKQNGVVKNTGYDRKSVRFNFENRPVKWLNLGLNTTLSYNVQNYSALTGDYPSGIAMVSSPLNPVHLEDGSYFLNFIYPAQTANPVASNEYNINRNTTFRGLTKLYGEVSLLQHFKYTLSVGADFSLTETKEKFDSRLYDPATSSVGNGRVQERDSRIANIITTNLLRYDNSFKKGHHINLLAGQEAQILTNKFLQGTGTGLILPNNDQIIATNTKVATGSFSKQTLLSFFGQANYDYRRKYLFTSSIRSDGSSRFGNNNQFGTYWSVGAGWVATEEPFMKATKSVLDYLKLRGSIGAAGNSFAIDRYTKYDILFTGNYLNNLAAYMNQPGNPNIKWEQTFTWDAGLEAKFWKERVSLTADLYKRKTSDLIYKVNVAYMSGFTSILDNIGDMVNKGIEFSLSVDAIRNKNFRWTLSGNWSTNKNVLVKANVPLTAIGGTTLANEEGRNFNSFYLIKWAGVNPADGTPMWVDSTGKNSSNKNAAKQEFVGKPQPDGFGAITNTFDYKKFQLSILFYYQYGFKIYNDYQLTNDGSSVYMNQSKNALDRWQKTGDIAANPQRKLNNTTATGNSTRFLYDGDFIRLQNLSLSYSVSKKLIERLGLSSLRVYAQAYNLAVWTKFPGGDVSNTNSNGGSTLSYPNQRTYSLGVNLGL